MVSLGGWRAVSVFVCGCEGTVGGRKDSVFLGGWSSAAGCFLAVGTLPMLGAEPEGFFPRFSLLLPLVKGLESLQDLSLAVGPLLRS